MMTFQLPSPINEVSSSSGTVYIQKRTSRETDKKQPTNTLSLHCLYLAEHMCSCSHHPRPSLSNLGWLHKLQATNSVQFEGETITKINKKKFNPGTEGASLWTSLPQNTFP